MAIILKTWFSTEKCGDVTEDRLTLDQVMAWCHQAPSGCYMESLCHSESSREFKVLRGCRKVNILTVLYQAIASIHPDLRCCMSSLSHNELSREFKVLRVCRKKSTFWSFWYVVVFQNDELGLLSQFPLFHYFTDFSPLLKRLLIIIFIFDKCH